MAGAGRGAAGAAGGVLALEVCAPLLLLCWLCCWPDDASSGIYLIQHNSTSGKHPQRPVLSHAHESGSRRRSSEVLGRRAGSSAVSLHLPSTSGSYKKPLSAHRSHEEIARRKLSQAEAEAEARYHSAPSVIDEVLHRRAWERSARDLRVPLHSPGSPSAPRASPESSPDTPPHPATPACKKHHSNIKCSRPNKEKLSTDIKDDDESPGFYIGESSPLHGNIGEGSPRHSNNDERCDDTPTRSAHRGKDDKQSLNESIRSRERRAVPDERHPASLGFCLSDVIEQLDRLTPPDRSGAAHRSAESRVSTHRALYPPPSVEPVGYDGGACYLAESGALSELRGAGARDDPAGALRARHASDGDILAPPHRPESGAFSESDLELELEGAEERPPPYHELQQHAAPDRKETAI
ncbi:uncharacterized protein LOC124642202 [Helicoverpa zea]|uniref:uncharacterized protein LOC124642202 n=1 Tax=Helicoverpa zea TaxID=7113 RepID=UPI001F5AA95E|nr:uncharacterized protein LOC124642202 [Helicoverpa zea]